MSRPADVLVQYAAGDTVGLVVPVSKSAEFGLAQHVTSDAAHVGRGLVVEHRYIGPIIGGVIGDWLTVQ